MKKRDLLLLVLGIFLFGFFSLNLLNAQVAYDGSNNIYRCGDVNVSGIYTLNQSIFSVDGCLNITKNNVIIDGKGNTINYDTGVSENMVGIYIAGDRKNITLKNATITADPGTGIYSIFTEGQLNDSVIENIYARSIGIYFTGDLNRVNITSCNVGSIVGIAFFGHVNSLILNGSIVSNSFDNILYFYGNLTNSTIRGNTLSSSFSGAKKGIDVEGYSYGNLMIDNSITVDEVPIYFLYSVNDYLFGNNLNYGVYGLSVGDGRNLTIKNNTLSSSGGLAMFHIGGTSSNTLNFIDQSIGYLDLVGAGLTIENSSAGKIYFPKTFGTPFTVGADVGISTNYAFVNSNIVSELNTSANITFYNLPTHLVNPKIIRNGVDVCNSTTGVSCYNFTSLSAGNVTFNVSSWSNYSISYTLAGDPLVYLFSISNVSSVSKNITFNVSDSYANVTNCSLYINGVYNQSNSSIINQSADNIFVFNSTNLVVGTYNASVSCFDFDNYLGISSNVSFSVSLPVIHLFVTENSTSTSRTLVYNVSDDYANVANCSIYLNGIYNHSNGYAINKSINNSFYFNSNLAVGSYNASVKCTDEWNFIGYSNNVSFTVLPVPAVETSASSSGGGGLNLDYFNLNNLGAVKGALTYFSIGNQTHSLRVINLTGNSVLIELKSTIQQFSLNLGESKVILFDNVYLNVTLKKIIGVIAYLSLAKVEILPIKNEINTSNNSNTAVNGEDNVPSSEEENNSLIWIISAVVLVLIIVFAVYLIKGHRELKRHPSYSKVKHRK